MTRKFLVLLDLAERNVREAANQLGWRHPGEQDFEDSVADVLDRLTRRLGVKQRHIYSEAHEVSHWMEFTEHDYIDVKRGNGP